MSNMDKIKSFLNGPVHHKQIEHFDFYYTEGDNYRYVVYDQYTGDWKASLHALVQVKAPNLALAISMVQKEWDEIMS